MEDKYKRREHIALAYLSDKWQVRANPSFVDFVKWKLIHKKHKEILDAYLEDNNVEIEFIDINKNWNKDNGFIKYYNENSIYRLKNKKEKEPETIQAPNSEIQFLKPDFECKLFFEDSYLSTYGIIKELKYGVYWDKLGKCFKAMNNNRREKYDLTPYKEKKEWYEDESNFPCVVVNQAGYMQLAQELGVKDNQIVFVFSKSGENIELYNTVSECRRATNEEVDSLKKETK